MVRTIVLAASITTTLTVLALLRGVEFETPAPRHDLDERPERASAGGP
jgi:hypothetical protein